MNLKVRNGTQEREAMRFKRAYERLQRTERRMLRAVHAWEAARDSMKGLEKRADKPKNIGGTYTPEELLGESEQVKEMARNIAPGVPLPELDAYFRM